MLYFTKYAENKFELLNKYQVFLRKEQIEEAVNLPDKTSRKGKYFSACKEGVKVIYEKEGEVIRILTFFPAK